MNKVYLRRGTVSTRERSTEEKVRAWVSKSGPGKFEWAARYLWKRAGGSRFPLGASGKAYSEDYYKELVAWFLLGKDSDFKGVVFDLPLTALRYNPLGHFESVRNAWNQRVNRARKTTDAANSITLDPKTVSDLKKLAQRHGLSEKELLSILVDLLVERGNVVEDLAKQRKKMKRAAISADLGLGELIEPPKTSL